jgi:hypothetical protein
MTIATGFLAKSAQIGGVTLAGTTEFSVNDGGSVVPLKSDGELYQRVIPIIPENITIEATTRDIASTVTAGTSGALSMVADKMTGGKTLSGTLTFSATTSTITSVTRVTDISGQTVLRISAVINSADGAASGLTITSA